MDSQHYSRGYSSNQGTHLGQDNHYPDTSAIDFIFKVVLAGDQDVGKSNLLLRCKSNEFNADSQVTIGIEFVSKFFKIETDQTYVKAQIWDTAGQERFRSITGAYYRNAVGALLVYDITQRSSFESVEKWIKAIKEHADPNIVMILVGNKSDLADQRQVKQEDAVKFAEKHRTHFPFTIQHLLQKSRSLRQAHSAVTTWTRRSEA